MIRHYPKTSNYHRKSAKNNNFNIWQSWLYQREIGRVPPLGFRDRQNKDTYSAINTVTYSDITAGDFNHGAIFNLEFSPDGKILVAACEAKSFLVFDPLNGRLINSVKHAHNDCVNCIRFLDSRMFATCSDDTTVALWDIRFPKNRIRSLRGHSNWVKNIEYASNSRLLVTSGFDGSVFVWDINRYTEDMQFKQVCHVNGLMRTKLTPDESTLVMCTTAGYMMTVHNLDLPSLASDLNLFNPNTYRLMQLTGNAVNRECRFNRLFASKRKRNRVEFISDFPKGNPAEIISSLQIHPQGWCVLSRNTSSDKQSEWTCIHDLQDQEYDSSSDDEDEDIPDEDTSASSSQTNPSNNEDSLRTPSRPVLRFHLNYHPAADQQNPGSSSNSQSSESLSPNQQVDVEVQLTNSELLALLSPSYRTIQVSGSQLAQAIAQARNATNAEDGTLTNGAIRPNIMDRPSILLHAMSQLVAQSAMDTPIADPDPSSSTDQATNLKIRQNSPRLTYFCREKNVGPGFIKELCFSPDGRFVCSPYDHGIRLFAFDSDCREMCDSVPSEPQPLHELTKKKSHPNVVVSTKYSPTHPLIVSGCLSGKVCFHQPVLP